MSSLEKYQTFTKKDLIFFGVHLSAFTNEKGEIKKTALYPSKWKGIQETEFNEVYDKVSGEMKKPNAIAVVTELSDIDIIDVDDPKNCDILDDLLNDCGFIIKTRKGYHFYFKKTDLPRRKLCGIADFNTNLLYYCPKYKHTETNEVFRYEIFKDKKIKQMPDYAYKWAKTVIRMSEAKPQKEKKVKDKKEKIIKDPNITTNIFDIDTLKVIYKIFLEAGQFDEYTPWQRVAWMTRHVNNSEQAYKLYHKFSRKAEGYENVSKEVTRAKFYDNNTYDENFDSNGILWLCRSLNKEKFDDLLKHLEKGKYDDIIIKIKSKYIYTADNYKKYFLKWVEDNKVMMIKSAYGTGKTFFFKKLIQENPQFKRVLFLTYRQSLAMTLSQELQELYGFHCYLDENKSTDLTKFDKLILQLDSIAKLIKYGRLATYDIIILDEIEGLLNHMSFDKLDRVTVFETLQKVVRDTGKVLCLDGDLDNRACDFINNITEDYTVIQNEYQPNQKVYTFYRNLASFDQKIEKDMKEGKKLVIVAMSKAETEKYYKYYSRKYNVIIHNSIEPNKKILRDVNKEWKKCDMLIYSPSVEAGCDFNQKHFDKCYGIMTNLSCSHRAFSQMLNRVREYETNNVDIYTGHLLINSNKPNLQYQEYVSTFFKDIELCPMQQVLVHNMIENYNAKTNLLGSFIDLITSKGHTYKFDDKPYKKEKKEFSCDDIIEADELSKEEFKDLMKMQEANEYLTRAENMAIEKYVYRQTWKIEYKDLDDEFMKTHFKKNHVVANFKDTIQEVTDRPKFEKNDLILEFKYKKVDIIKTLVSQLENVESLDEFKRIVSSTFNNQANKLIFNIDRQLKTKNHLTFINDILNDYGYNVEKFKKNKKINKKVVTSHIFKCKTLDIITEYLKRIEAQKQA